MLPYLQLGNEAFSRHLWSWNDTTDHVDNWTTEHGEISYSVLC